MGKKGKIIERVIFDSPYQKFKNSGIKGQVLDKRRPGIKSSRIVRCEYCGIMMQVELGEYKRGRARYCSRSCVSKSILRNQTGPLNNNWKGGESKNNAKYAKRYKRKYPERVRAYGILKRALKRGDIKKEPCKVCGNLKVQAYYKDWNKPLKVVWLCKKHHIEKSVKTRRKRNLLGRQAVQEGR